MRSMSDIMKCVRACSFSCTSYAVLDAMSKNRVYVNTMEGRKAEMYLSSGPQGVWLNESLGSQDVVNQSPPPPAPKKKKTSLWKRFKNMFRRTKNKKKRCGEVSSTRKAKMNESSCSQGVGLNQSPGSEYVWWEESPPPPLPTIKKTSLWRKAKMYLSSGPQGVWLKESLGSQDVVNQSPPPPAPKKKKTSLWKRFKNMFRRTKNKKKRCGEVSKTRCVVPLMTKVHLKKGPLTGSWVNIGPDSDADDENSEDYSGIKNFTREIFFKAIDEFETDLKRYRDQHQYLQPNAVMKFTLDEEFEEHAQIRDWEVISKIGKGFGTVYKAKNIHSEMEVVLKKGLYLEESEIVFVSWPRCCESVHLYELLLCGHSFGLFQEAEMMKRLDHQSIVKLIEVHQDELCKRVVLVMESVPGDTLTHRLDLQKKFSPNEASVMMKQIASAFAYMHSKNVFHRNIKLDSIICNDLWHVKVVGFGLACVFTQGEKFDDCHGSHDYIAPEIFFESSHEGPPVDVWALGILFTKLLVGPEFSAFNIMRTSDDFTIFNAVLYNPPRCASQLLISLLARMLHADPMKRPTMEEISNPKWYR